MKDKRNRKPRRAHYGILVNPRATNYDRRYVRQLIEAIKQAGRQYSVVEPASAMEFYGKAMVLSGARKAHRGRPLDQQKRGPVTALIVCGGDGSFNLVARAAIKANLPVGAIPMGRHNNISRSLMDISRPEAVIKRLLEGKETTIDAGNAVGQTFFGSIGFGLAPALQEALAERESPRFGIGWSRLGAKVADSVDSRQLVLKVDAFRFEVTPVFFNINLLPFSCGIRLSPASLASDGLAEVLFDVDAQPRDLGGYLRLSNNNKYIFGNGIRLYRGKVITIQPTEGLKLYLDGELISVPANYIEVKIERERLRVIC